MFKTIKSRFTQLWVFLRREVWPVKGRKYFERNLDLVFKIAADHRHGRIIQLIYVLLVMSTILSLVQCFHTEPAFTLLTFDALQYNKLPTSLKFSKALINIATIAIYNVVYFELGKIQEFKKYIQVLRPGNRTLVLGSNFDFWKLIDWSLSIYQIFVLGFDLAFIISYVQFCVVLGHLCSALPLYLWPLSYLSMSIGFALFSASALLICVGGFLVSLGLLGIKFIFERLNRQRQQYLHHPINRSTPGNLLNYRRENTKTMMLVLSTSPIYGHVLLTFLWTNVPFNVTLATMFILNNMPNMLAFFIGLVTMIGQITVFIFIHLVEATITDRLHRPYTTIYSQFVRCPRWTLSSHVRVSTNIEAFLVRKRYGVTYQQFGMNFGLVSMAAFLKFVFLYLEMVLYCYSMYLKSK